MSFRDDHDAALARVDALERELAETRARLEAAEAALRARRSEASVTQARGRVRTQRISVWFWVAILVGAVGLTGLVVATGGDQHAPEISTPLALSAGGLRRVSAADALAEAEAAVERAHPGARLDSLSVSFVDDVGVLHLDRGGRATYRFRTDVVDRAATPCGVTFELSRDGWKEFTSAPCGPLDPPLAPRCDLVGLWVVALSRGASRGQLASIDGDRDAGGVLTWRFRIIATSGTVTLFDVPDDCPAP